MTLKKTAAIVTLMSGCALTTLNVGHADAMTLMDLFRRNRAPETFQTLPEAAPAPAQEQPARRSASASPAPRVVGPKYYTYKAEAPRRIETDRLVDPVVTGSLRPELVSTGDTTLLNDARPYMPSVTAYAAPDVAKTIEAYYAGTDALIWIDAKGVNDRARAAMAVLADAASVGLDPQDYAVTLPTETPDATDMAAREKALVSFEIRLSAAVLTYVQDTVRGRIDPNAISGYHDFKRKDVNLAGKMRVIAASHDVAAFLATQTPSNVEFTALRNELKRLEATAGGQPRIEIPEGTLLKPGIADPGLPAVVAAIKAKGSDALKTEHAATLDAYQGSEAYTPDLVALVEGFQKENGLKPDGIVGRASIRILSGGDSNADRISKLRIAMEQARWLPADLGSRYVFINQPAFTASYHDGGVEQFNMRVVVGSKTNQTYFFEDEIQTVEFNPYWGVPQSIIINEMLPKLRSDPGYLDRLGYQVEVGGRPVSSYDVDWYGSTKSVSVRQPPSDDNALGELKILFPNAHAIYMHDTPSKSFFKKDMRALSHGCVRLADPRRMAAAVLGTTVEDVAKQIADGRNKGVSVPSRIPVYVAYFTAWPDKNGHIAYFDDVYDRDMYMNRAFDATRQVRRIEG
ncbi:L,D-transpeptidase family protein [Rhizobium sp. Leaf341]|uniref:L,D-transpeptidase family protein n=1 Tax=Rhizobium sp. Leaf341 TaxID=1736344 RepID=UPI000715DEAD|nr:murein L,D-transpeptidase [Rhizobium sp. Leaf341]KQR67919.1 peptidoglycan-binding protein [Rhizobium sp. Leaf341]